MSSLSHLDITDGSHIVFSDQIDISEHIGVFCLPPLKVFFLQISRLTSTMVIISYPKVNYAIPDRFQVFLDCQNDFWMLWAHRIGKN